MTEQTLFDVPSRPVDAERRAVLELIAGDPLHARDRETIVAAIWYVAGLHNMRVDTNIVRARLTDPATGELVVYPRVIGAVFNSLAARRILVADGWTPSTDRKGGNYGKPQRVWRLHPPQGVYAA